MIGKRSGGNGNGHKRSGSTEQQRRDVTEHEQVVIQQHDSSNNNNDNGGSGGGGGGGGNTMWARLVARNWLRIGVQPKKKSYNADSDADGDSEESPKPRNSPHVLQPQGSLWKDCVDSREYRIFVGTWNVAGIVPPLHLDLDDWLDISSDCDIYVIGLQEIVPLKAGRVFGPENQSAGARWDSLLRRALNRKPPLEGGISRSVSAPMEELCTSVTNVGAYPDSPASATSAAAADFMPISYNHAQFHQLLEARLAAAVAADEDIDPCTMSMSSSSDESIRSNCPRERHSTYLDFSDGTRSEKGKPKYRRVASKQMVGLFISVWVKTHLRRHVQNISVSCVGCGIMGRGNKGSVSVSMKMDDTNLCFVCSHLAAGEKEGDETRRNTDIADIIKRTHFSASPAASSSSSSSSPRTILAHDRIFWFGDLNYRLTVMHGKAMAYIERQDWENLLQFDQLSIEKSSGRIFDGWHEGSIDFAPTYKYAPHSDQYSGILNNKSGERRRIPAWCDRIVWHGKGMKQLSYRRAELRNSDHRPVCGTFVVNVEGLNSRKLQKKVNMSFKLAEAQQVLDGCAKDSSKSKKSSKHGTSSHAEEQHPTKPTKPLKISSSAAAADKESSSKTPRHRRSNHHHRPWEEDPNTVKVAKFQRYQIAV